MYVRWIPQASIYSSNRIELILRSFWGKNNFFSTVTKSRSKPSDLCHLF